MPSWDRSLEDWIVGHRIGVLDPFAEGLSYVGSDAAIWLAIALVLAVVRRRGDVIAWTAAAGIGRPRIAAATSAMNVTVCRRAILAGG